MLWFFWTLPVLLQRWLSTCLVCVHTLTPRENRVRNIFKNSEKTKYLMNTLYLDEKFADVAREQVSINSNLLPHPFLVLASPVTSIAWCRIAVSSWLFSSVSMVVFDELFNLTQEQHDILAYNYTKMQFTPNKWVNNLGYIPNQIHTCIQHVLMSVINLLLKESDFKNIPHFDGIYKHKSK